MLIAKRKDATTKFEYGCDLRRLYPWAGVAAPPWGAAIASVRAGEATTAHSHDEDETFLILKGEGEITVDNERQRLEHGDVIFLPRNCTHTIRNTSSEITLDFLTIYWGGKPDQDQSAQPKT